MSIRQSHSLMFGTKESPSRKGGSELSQLRMNLGDLVMFSRQISIMIESGVQVRDALCVLEAGASDEDSRAIINFLLRKIEGGSSLAQAFSAFPQVFSPIFVAMIRMSEESGQIGNSFGTLANWLERDEKTIRGIKAALVYPSLVVVLSLGLSVVFFTFIFPTFAESLSGVQELPLLTKFLMLISNCLTSPFFWLSCTGLTFLGFQGYRQSSKTLAFRLGLWRILSGVPVVGPLQRDIAAARFSAAMSVMMESGVDFLRTFRLACQVSGSVAIEHSMEEALSYLRDGGGLSDYLQGRTDIYPELLVALVVSGEEAAQLPEMFKFVSESLEDSCNDRIRALISLLEPILVLGVSTFVAIFVLGIALPMYQVVQDI